MDKGYAGKTSNIVTHCPVFPVSHGIPLSLILKFQIMTQNIRSFRPIGAAAHGTRVGIHVALGAAVPIFQFQPSSA